MRALVARMDLGGMGPLVARALDPRRMTLAKKDVAEYAGVAIPFYKRWAHRHEFLLRCQQRGETVEEYFRAKRELLVEGDTYERLAELGAGGLDGCASPGTRLVRPDHGSGPSDRRVGR